MAFLKGVSSVVADAVRGEAGILHFPTGESLQCRGLCTFVGFFGNISQERLTGDETADYSCYK